MPQRLVAAFASLGRRITFTTGAFGLDDQAITHAISAAALDHIVTIDTGRLFPETYDIWEERRFGRAR